MSTVAYSDWAEDYDRHVLSDCAYRIPDVIARAAASLAGPGERWLDLGAGTGLVGASMQRIGCTPALTAVDLCAPMLDRITCPLYRERVLADACGVLPFDEGTFDGAIAAGLLEHVPDPRVLFAEVARILRSRGAFLFTFCPSTANEREVFEPWSGLLSHGAVRLADGLRASGFEREHEREFAAYRNRGKWVQQRLVIVRRAVPGQRQFAP